MSFAHRLGPKLATLAGLPRLRAQHGRCRDLDTYGGSFWSWRLRGCRHLGAFSVTATQSLSISIVAPTGFVLEQQLLGFVG